MEEKCFCHLNGYAVKDATARKEIESTKTSVNNLSNQVNNNVIARIVELEKHKEIVKLYEPSVAGNVIELPTENGIYEVELTVCPPLASIEGVGDESRINMHCYIVDSVNNTLTSYTILTHFYDAKFLINCDGNGNYVYASCIDYCSSTNITRSHKNVAYMFKNIAINCEENDVGHHTVLSRIRKI